MTEIQQSLFKTLCCFDDLCRKHGIEYFLGYGTLLGAIRHKGFIPWDDDIDVFMARDNYAKFLSLDGQIDGRSYTIDAWETDKAHHWPFAKFRNNKCSLRLLNDQRFESRGTGVWVDIFPFDPCPEAESKAFKRWYRKRKWLCSCIAVKSLKWGKTWTKRQKIGKLLVLFIARKLLISLFNRLNRRFILNGNCVMPAWYDDEIIVYPRELLECRPTYALFEGRSFPVMPNYDRVLTITYGDYMTPPSPEKRRGHF